VTSRTSLIVTLSLALASGCTHAPSTDGTTPSFRLDGDAEAQPVGSPAYGPTSEEWVQMPVRVLFPGGGERLDAEGQAMVDELRTALENRTDVVRVRVEGHADERGSSEANRRVARERAEAVVDHMVRELGMPREMFEIESYGDERPLTSETASADRTQNRRVEFSLLVRRPGEGGGPQLASAAPPPEVDERRETVPAGPRAVGESSDAVSEVPLVIYDAEIDLAVHEVRQRMNETIALARDLGGFLQSQHESSVIVRVPADRFWEAMTRLEGLGDVLDRQVDAQDVSEEVRDLRIRLRNATQMRERLEALLGQARSVEDSLAIERELERVTQSIELLRGQLEALQFRISYSTITVSFDTVASEPDEVPRERFQLPFRFLERLGLTTLMEL
jgi:outer membrane protein OmpA-like peptidoglycan-associated protein